MRAGPDQCNRSLRCDYHKDHGHETNHCQSLKFLVEKLIRARHLRRYIRESVNGVAVAPTANMVIANTEHASGPRQAINFILGGPADSQYQSKKKRRKMLRAASIRARVNTVRAQENITAVQPVDGPISFPPINPTQVITPHYDALVLTVGINNFDVHRVLVDPGSAVDLLHLPTFKQMRVPLDRLSSAGRVLSGFNGATTLTVGDIAFPVQAGLVIQQVLFSVVEEYLWLANVVVVPKKGNEWRVCVDYTDLNDACPKDSFPLPRIDQIVDASAGHGMLSFLDAFSGYHQIPMHPLDAEKTSFITPHGLYYYNVMSFGLKNAGATYQRLVTKMFRLLLDSTMEVYIDDMLVKSKQRLDHAAHL